MNASEEQAQDFAASFSAFLKWIAQAERQGSDGQEVVALVRDHLGEAGCAQSVVTKNLPPYEQVNLQTAIDAWAGAPGRTVQVHGISIPPHWTGLTLQQLTTGDGLPPVRLSAPQLIDLPNGPGTTLACAQLAIFLIDDDLGKYAVLVRGPEQHQEPALTVEVAGLTVRQAQAVHVELAQLRSRLNVYRGHVLELSSGQMGGISLTFADLPRTSRGQVVLPEEVLRRIERHCMDIAAHRDQLTAAGQHLKRGLLLFGPPGTGKTHTTRYVVGQMAGYTVLLLSGRSLHLVGMITELARELQPAVVVLEDVDLIAEDRGFGPGSSPVLFDLLDAMDGAAADADLLFLLTTNRADLLEPALASRPGRIDVAIEIGLPDADARRQLLELYGQDVPLEWSEPEIEQVVARTAGTTASFMKELHRRAVLEALAEQSPLRTVTAAHMTRALDDLLDSSQSVTRALLGAGGSGSGDPSAGEFGAGEFGSGGPGSREFGAGPFGPPRMQGPMSRHIQRSFGGHFTMGPPNM